ncbi:unnamed protein product [Lactuca virosa]|uniref:Uncharacterized protein n=1 Tax=Lactuca virosa TaxID=75947 RepID=A0AAU9LXS1_9ASTR|nr:unnamed protein product [Lactuca virosa]
MKASMKFREEQKPLFRAKAPLKILGFPFQSGMVAGESKELSLNLSTYFESGPSLKVSYRPNDSLNSFSVVLKTGTGHFGSPISSSFNMNSEFNLSRGGQNPRFFVHFKPQFGDFIVKNVQSSVFKKQITGVVDEDAPVKGVLSDVEMTATTAVQLRKNTTLSFRWGFRVPATGDSSMVQMKMNNLMAGISL